MGPFWSSLFILFFVTSIAALETDDTQTFIARVNNALKPSDYFEVEQWYSSILEDLNSSSLVTTSVNAEIVHVYKTVFQGFSARLTPQQAEALKERSEIIAVFPDHVFQLQTTRSPEFLGLQTSGSNSLSNVSEYGTNIIIGLLDTGIWPERQSFNDEGLDPIPKRWKGECQGGERFPKTLCNKKLIGARYFSRYGGTARDLNGHGTHTASTAAGQAVSNASFLGYASGTAVGIAAKARLAVYAVCSEIGYCSDADILAGFDKAVEDGVDVISVSLGSKSAIPIYEDGVGIGSFGAMEKGIVVSAAGGNSGPSYGSVINISPWLITVGAGTIDRKFPADLVLENGVVINGLSLFQGNASSEYSALIYAGNASFNSSADCAPGSLNKTLVFGKIVVCDRGDGVDAPLKGLAVKEAGGIGVIVANVHPYGGLLVSEAYLNPGLGINESARQVVLDYISSTSRPRGAMLFGGTQIGVKPAPLLATFSSRGPNKESLHVLKPDVIAPGVEILAAWSNDTSPTKLSEDPRRTEFNVISGTSMACPHVSGIAALLKGAHQDWSPAMIKSAIMTTAYTVDRDGNPLREETDMRECNAWDMGAGHVDPMKAIDPGLVYDLTSEDYVDFLCASNMSEKHIEVITQRAVKCEGRQHSNPWDLNYPAISVTFEGKSREIVVKRTVTHVSEEKWSYEVKVKNPKGVIAKVDPEKMVFEKKGEKLSYVVKITRDEQKEADEVMGSDFGEITWTDGKHRVNSPLVVMWT